MAGSVKGYLQLKKKAKVKDSWNTYLVDFNLETRVLAVKSKDGKVALWDKEVDRAWGVEARANRRPNRFDVISTDGVVSAFAAPKKEDMENWIEALTPPPPLTSPSFEAATRRKSLVPANIGDFSNIAEDTMEDKEEEVDEMPVEPRKSGTDDWAADVFTFIDEPVAKTSSSDILEVSKSEQEEEEQVEVPNKVITNPVSPINDIEGVSDEEKEEEKDQIKTNLNKVKTFDLYEAPDGFRGTFDQVLAHEKLLEEAQNNDNPKVFSVYEADDGFRGSYEQVLAHEKEVEAVQKHKAKKNLSVYQAPDGFRGTYEQVLAYEKKLEFQERNKPSFSVYQAPDGFRGTYEQVLAHEKKLGLEKQSNTHSAKTYSVYKSADSLYHGTYEEVLAYERKTGLVPTNVKTYSVYESIDGFRGTYEQVLEYEKEMEKQEKRKIIEARNKKLKRRAPGKFQLYEAPDGFLGSYEQVLAHEKEYNLCAKAQHVLIYVLEKDKEEGGGGGGGGGDTKKKTFDVFEAPDGFRGTYDEVLAHEETLNHKWMSKKIAQKFARI